MITKTLAEIFLIKSRIYSIIRTLTSVLIDIFTPAFKIKLNLNLKASIKVLK